MSVQAPAALDATTIEHVSRGEPAWLGTLRADWWRRVEADPWPTGAEEEWRRTSVIADLAAERVLGRGPEGYRDALAFLAEGS